jgi:hypothetical protein
MPVEFYTNATTLSTAGTSWSNYTAANNYVYVYKSGMKQSVYQNNGNYPHLVEEEEPDEPALWDQI